MTAPVDLPQLTALLERADSKGWGLDVDGDLTARVPTCWREGAWVNEQGRANAALVVAAIAALPALIAELTAARERLAELEQMHDECICPKCGVRHGGSKIDGGFCHD